MMSEKKKDGFFFVMLVVAILFGVFLMSRDYVTYLVQRESLQICDVQIKDMEYMGHNGDRWACFDFKDDNISIQGRVISNWWEKEGDIITIAYSQDYRFIRTQIIYDSEELSLVVFCVFMLIVMIIHFLGKRKN